jgi:hypothetical protein
MTQEQLNFNPLPLPDDLSMTPQDKRLYERLTRGPIRNIDIHREVGLLHYSRRFSTIREKLEPHGWNYTKKFEGNGVFTYQLERRQEAA